MKNNDVCIIELKGLTKTFDDQQVLKGIDLKIFENEFLMNQKSIEPFDSMPVCYFAIRFT